MKIIRVQVEDAINKEELDIIMNMLSKIVTVTYIITFKKDITWTK